MFDIILIHNLIMTLKTEHLSSNFTLKFHKRNNPDKLIFFDIFTISFPFNFRASKGAK